MYSVPLRIDADEQCFRITARHCLAMKLPPSDISFTTEGQANLFATLPATDEGEPFTIPRSFAELLRDAVCHSATDRFALLYGVLWRIHRGERKLAENLADPAVARLHGYAHNVRRDIHKMHAFLRFREQIVDGRSLFSSWFEPQHFILRCAAPFFADRFAGMDWVIATPIGTAAWDRAALVYGPPAAKPTAASDVILDDLWLTYYRTTFNPARLRIKAMTAEMPKHYWTNMPESTLIPSMIAGAGKRVDEMRMRAPLPPPVFAEKIAAGAKATERPAAGSPDELATEIRACRRCPLHCAATRAVPGEGPANARIMLVGEQPGDREDLAGRPFVGPAGQMLDKALAEAGLARDRLYLTNAVKHFKYEPRGKRRIHQKPNAGEVQTCKWWLDREIALVKPRLIVALGATAAGALAARPVSVTKQRGAMMFGEMQGFVTVHPSFLLRVPDEERKAEEFHSLVSDLDRVRELGDERAAS